MRHRTAITSVLQSAGFSLHQRLGRILGVGFLSQCLIVTGLAACAILLSSIFDRSLVLPGRDVGLLQHPSIWGLFLLQAALPLSIAHSLKGLLHARTSLRTIAAVDGTYSELILAPLLRFVYLENREGRATATAIYCVGFAAFVWNTFQNQRPGVVVPYDFWDSTTYFWGFWVTRVYKLYLFAWLLPYCALIHIGILVVTLRLIRRARESGRLKLLVFHPDGVGGLGFVPSLVTTPIIVTVLLGSVPMVGAFEIHRAADVTPLMGLMILVASAAIAYIVPILLLRADIVAVKQQMVERLRFLQQAYYERIVESRNLDFDTLRDGNECFDYFGKVNASIRAISNYPHLRRVMASVGVALTPSVISFVLKLRESIEPIMHPLTRKS